MFGYLQAEKGELRVREYEQYKAVYCTLCKQLGCDYGIFTRFILSYDMTLFALLSLSLQNTCPGFEKHRCTFNPLKKCTYCSQRGEPFEKASALSVITAYYKILDDIQDSPLFKRAGKKILRLFFSRKHKKASQKFPQYEQIVSDMVKNQKAAENDKNCHIDKASEPTAVMMKEILSLEGKNDMQIKVLQELGYQLGRWVYIIDAADDIKDDIKENSFNPLKAYYDGDEKSFKEKVFPMLNQCAANVYNAFSLLDLKHFDTILDNIFLLGLKNQQQIVLEGKKSKGKRKEN